MIHFRTFSVDLFPAHWRLVVNIDETIVTLVDAEGSFQQQQSVTPVSLLLALPALEAYPEYVSHAALLAVYRDCTEEQAQRLLAAATTHELRTAVLKPLRTAVHRAKQQFALFGILLVAVNECGYQFLPSGSVRRTHAFPLALPAAFSEGVKTASPEERTTTNTLFS